MAGAGNAWSIRSPHEDVRWLGWELLECQSGQQGTDVQVGVVAVHHAFVETAKTLQGLPCPEAAGDTPRAVRSQKSLKIVPAFGHGVPRLLQVAGGVTEQFCREHPEITVRVGCGDVKALLDTVRSQKVVGVEEHDVRCGAGLNSDVSASRRTFVSVGSLQDPNFGRRQLF